MTKARHPSLVRDEMRDLDAIAKAQKEILRADPNDPLTNAMVIQLVARKQRLNEELQSSLALYGYNSLSLAFQTTRRIPALILSKSIFALQGILNELVARIDRSIKVVPLFLDLIYDGSYGVSFSTEWEEVFAGGAYGESILRMLGVLQKFQSGDFNNDNALNGKALHLINSFEDAQCDVDIVYGSAYSGERFDAHLSRDSIAIIKSRLLEAEDLTFSRQIDAMVGGVNLFDGTAVVIPREQVGVRMKLIFGTEMNDVMIDSLGHLCRISFEENISAAKFLKKVTEARRILDIERLDG